MNSELIMGVGGLKKEVINVISPNPSDGGICYYDSVTDTMGSSGSVTLSLAENSYAGSGINTITILENVHAKIFDRNSGALYQDFSAGQIIQKPYNSGWQIVLFKADYND